MEATIPIEITRTNLSGTFFLACFGGEGLVLIDGEWRQVSAGQACIQPPLIPNGLKGIPNVPWRFCWVRYQELPKRKPIVSLHSPALRKYDVTPIRLAVQGFTSEVTQGGDAGQILRWIELLHNYVLNFAHPQRQDERLTKIWSIVEHRLDEPWTLGALAEIGCVSKEHLRRLCLTSLGRSPVQHVTFLRMQKAASLLRSTNLTIEAVARQLGYASQFSFSDTFQRWFNCRPSKFREH
ncbi:AraC family transcriptional regulator [Blastopirellula sp. J2-11]|uniref:helix-turn-helix transcriptional regulator n=1 Tax=Blastopirellula sp. J2-11 TaxID=2943192 RepID=UPI0021C8022C|nr:AraC family transcriptional regulator [Blastopirellula sp. J2-11]UUO07162.1 AraC family transcriptional regulator [Blastopirellula sp. J2-11]